MKKTLDGAQRYVFILLKYRLRSQYEVTCKLKQKGFSDEIINETLDFFADLGYLDDLKFAQLWVSSRIRTKPRSKRFLEYELKNKGIAEDIIIQAVAEVDQDQEYSLAKDIAIKRFSKMSNLDKNIVKRRLVGILGRRGFNRYIVYNVLKEVVDNNEK